MSSNKKRAASSLCEEIKENARGAIEQILLKTKNAQGSLWSHGEVDGALPQLVLKGDNGAPAITLALSEDNVNHIKAQAECAPVGTHDSEVVQLNVRTTWQLLPGLDACLEKILPQVAPDLGI